MRHTPLTRTAAITAAGLTALLTAAACGTAEADGAADGTPSVAVVAAPTEEEIAALFTEWNAALATLDPERVADRYAPEAVLLPTLSNEVRTDRAGLVDYFEHFLENKPQGEILESHIDILDENSAVDAGTYRFTLQTEDGESTVDARYTYVYELIDGEWLIVDHHSSAMPED